MRRSLHVCYFYDFYSDNSLIINKITKLLKKDNDISVLLLLINIFKKIDYFFRKMYQHSKVGLKGKQISINIDDKTSVKQAQDEGNLHEILLDRRVKTKSDKYC